MNPELTETEDNLVGWVARKTGDYLVDIFYDAMHQDLLSAYDGMTEEETEAYDERLLNAVYKELAG